MSHILMHDVRVALRFTHAFCNVSKEIKKTKFYQRLSQDTISLYEVNL